MNDINNKYIGRSISLVKEELLVQEYDLEIKSLEPQKDKEILLDEIVVKIDIKGKKATIITSMFKNIYEKSYIFFVFKILLYYVYRKMDK